MGKPYSLAEEARTMLEVAPVSRKRHWVFMIEGVKDR